MAAAVAANYALLENSKITPITVIHLAHLVHLDITKIKRVKVRAKLVHPRVMLVKPTQHAHQDFSEIRVRPAHQEIIKMKICTHHLANLALHYPPAMKVNTTRALVRQALRLARSVNQESIKIKIHIPLHRAKFASRVLTVVQVNSGRVLQLLVLLHVQTAW